MPARVIEQTLPNGWPAYELTHDAGRWRAVAVPADGGSLGSLTLADHGELLHRALDYTDPPAGHWVGRAPLLWPAVGRNFTPAELASAEPRCSFEEGGRTWYLPLHGFARDRAWQVVDRHADDDEASVTFALTDDEATRAVYPWPFRVEVTHRLAVDWLETTVAVTSREALRFGVGSHLTLALPAAWEQIRLATNARCRLPLTPAGLLADAPPEPLTASSGRLGDLGWFNTVLADCPTDPTVTLTYPGGQCLEISQRVSRGSRHTRPADGLLVLWGRPAEGFLCPEPWWGRPNGLQTGVGAVRLPAGEVFVWTMRLTEGIWFE